MASKTSARRLEAEEKRAQALALRKQGLTYRQIAKAVGCHESRAFQIVTAELSRLAKEAADSADQVRTLELARLDHMLGKLFPILNDTVEPDPEVHVKDNAKTGVRTVKITARSKSNRELAMMAMQVVLKVMDRRAKYLGLDSAPEGDDLADRILDRYEGALAKVYGETEAPESS